MPDRRNRPLLSRTPIEARTGLVAIILVSSLAFLLLQARKDIQSNLAIHEARLALQFATVAAQPGIAELKTVIDDPGRALGDAPSGLAPLAGQATIAIPLAGAGVREPALALLGVHAAPQEDTGGKFVIRNGRLFAAIRDGTVAVMTSAPVTALTVGLWSRLAIDIGCVVFLGSLLLLVRESRLSDYSVRRLLDSSPVPLLLIDDAGRAEFANAAAHELFPGTPAGSVGGLKSALARHGALFDWLVAADGVEGAAETREFALLDGDGTTRHVLVSRQALVVRARRMIIASIVDITVRHEAEMALVRAKNAAEALGRMKSESLAMISHELRTPVNGVLGLAQLLARQPLAETPMRIVRRMVEASRTLGVIINDIVDLALLEIGHMRLERRSFDPRETITAAVTLASAAAPEKGLGVRVTMLSPLPPEVFGDPARLQQILINLVGNGIKFTEAGGIEVRTDVARRDEATIELAIEVIDSGIGIAAEVLPRLFQPFSQAETGRSRRYGGTGLGLAISKGLAEAMGGGITAESELGRGSTFRVRLPFGLAADVEAAPRGPLAGRVLVVDDVALNRDVVADLLRAEGCTVEAVSSAEEALAALSAGRYDLVLMDIRMPEVDGLAATRAIRADPGAGRHLGPVIGLTAHLAATDRPLYLLRGLDAVIEKPVEADRLRAALARTPQPPRAAAEPARLVHLRETLGHERTDRILAAFAGVAEEAVEAIAEGCSRLDMAGLADHAHRLAGAARNVGFDGLAEAAERLEEAVADGPAAVAEAALPLVAAHHEAAARIAALPRGGAAAAEPALQAENR
ncbi:hybrid sensor histidine kinase/response regulator [Prosthecomicrobium pneumaticum]|uniref:histidine kinase n=1 Tax=Prosthecomicrobium pneumaticum TaxID=81895 RepID=A0A7W9FLI8_9HYPH|nr:ATP-binding protein [Prosthecomicrobium pneumaticum]MBB5752893.1 PAS domain S-box-containing protein [Prosthecomicrobium pneumaticum]